MTTPNRPPLWEVMQNAGSNAPGEPRDAVAAEIRALRDWLVPEEPLYDGDQRRKLERDERQHLRNLLTAEADRAERGRWSIAELSPAAQAVYDAATTAAIRDNADWPVTIAAALRVAADQVVPQGGPFLMTASEDRVRHQLLAIAAELEAQP